MPEVPSVRRVRARKSIKKSSLSKNQPYSEIKIDAERRSGVKIKAGRNGEERTARVYSLSEEKLAARLALWRERKRFVSPYSRGIMTDLLTALSNVALNKAAPYYLVKQEMERVMSTADRTHNGRTDWERFVGKPKQSEKKPFRLDAKIKCHALSLRKNNDETTGWPVGFKLAQMGCCVDIFRVPLPGVPVVQQRKLANCLEYMRLNTHSVKPLKMWCSSEGEIPPVDRSKPTLGPS